ncbi:hypothetical protein WME76_13950 [Sorangium sp. So ce119]|uniref:hypothetical protein n=1 Tax=Sorangium sp. So ce119 TaxID=3133279 RepID=UPI003F5E2705
MPHPEVRLIVLYEDRAHDSFLRRFFKKHPGHGRVRFEKCVDSSGVLKRLGAEVDALRSQKHQQNLGLVVVIDADEKGLSHRLGELDARIGADTSDGRRTVTERIALVVPALEIETWYVHLCDPSARPVDETKDYKTSPTWRELAKDLGAASRRAVDAWPLAPDRPDPASLSAARNELRRVGLD